MSSRIIYVVRHGETEYNRLNLLQGRSIDADLNDTGRAQAARLARFFEAVPVDFVAASSRLRAIRTAEAIATVHSLPISTTPDIDEMHFGELEGKSYKKAEPELIRLRDLWRSGETNASPKGGESPETVFLRADRAIRELIRTNHFQTGVFVVHGRLIRIILSGWLGIGLSRMEQIEHTNAAVNMLEFKNGTFSALALNITSHLDTTKVTLA